jgi:peptidoglycan biosynthesis protein MviN/MurJ (putative lipid II flippase)
MKVPIGIFGMAIGVASYPTISRMVAAGNVVEAYGTLAHAVRFDALSYICRSDLSDINRL